MKYFNKIVTPIGLLMIAFGALIVTNTINVEAPYGFLLSVFAEPDCENPGPGDFDYCIEKIQKEIDALSPAHEYNKKELADLKEQIKSLGVRIAALSKQLEITQADIRKREEDLAYAQEIFEEKADHHYRFIRLYDPITPFLASSMF